MGRLTVEQLLEHWRARPTDHRTDSRIAYVTRTGWERNTVVLHLSPHHARIAQNRPYIGPDTVAWWEGWAWYYEKRVKLCGVCGHG